MLDEAAKNYFENPSLVIALSLAVVCLGFALWWLVRWVLNKLVPIIEKNTIVLDAVLKYLAKSESQKADENRDVVEVVSNNTRAINELTTEQKILTSVLKKS